MVQMKLLVWLAVFFWCLLDHGVDTLSVMEGDSVTLHTGVQTNQQEGIKWYYNNTCIAGISGDLSYYCTDDQCKERFRDRLKLDHQTGSLTIMNTTNTDSGEYTLKISSGSSDSQKIFIVSVTDSVSVMEGDSVTLHTGVQTNQIDGIRWYFNGIRIARINGDLSKICTDVQCNEDTERFIDRLKLDHQTGSLTIINTRNTDSGEYTLKISSSRSENDKIFIVSVRGFSGQDEAKRKTAKEGESFTLHPGVIRNPNDVILWYFSDIHIAEISDEPSKICTDDQCKERFRDRLELDHQTGSLTITHTRTEDSGEYTLQINNSRFSITKIFSVSVTAVPDSGLSSSVIIGGITVGTFVVVGILMAVRIYCFYRSKQTGNRRRRGDHPQENCVLGAVALTEVPQADDDKEETTFNLKTECLNS